MTMSTTTPKKAKSVEAYESPAAASIHEMMQGLEVAGAIDKATLRKFDTSCLTPVRSLSPAEIREIRERAGVSQQVFARYLNVSSGIVSKWECGEKRPAGASLKLLTLVQRKGLEAVA
jgi:putative transcriptional regulator